MIITGAHATGEPGVCYIDHVNEDNPTPSLGVINATNPCGEQPLLDFEACNLGSLNVSKFVLPDGSDLDWKALGEAAEYAVRFLDDVIDANHWPIPEIKEMSLGNRKIGLGIMFWWMMAKTIPMCQNKTWKRIGVRRQSTTP